MMFAVLIHTFVSLYLAPVHALELPAALRFLTGQRFDEHQNALAASSWSSREGIQLDLLDDQGLGRKADNAIWEKYASRPGCFKRAITSCDKHRLDERGQQRAAIFMALCEIQSATDGYVPPECAPFASEPVQDGVPPANCLKELIKVDRFWVSYSGYHRDIAQFCDIYRRRQNNDVALDVFETAMQQQNDFLHHLKASDVSRSEEHLRVMESLYTTQVKSIQEMQTLAQELTATTVAKQHQQIHELSSALAEAMSGFLELPATLVSEVLSRLDPEVLTPLLSRTELLSGHLSSFDTQLASTMAANTELHDVAISNFDLAREAQREQLELARLASQLSAVFAEGIALFNTTIGAAASAAAADINATFAHVTAHASVELNATFANLNATLARAAGQADATFAHYAAAAGELNATVAFVLDKVRRVETVLGAGKHVVGSLFGVWSSAVAVASNAWNVSLLYIVVLFALAALRRATSLCAWFLSMVRPLSLLFKWAWPFHISSRTRSNSASRSSGNFRPSRKPVRRVRFDENIGVRHFTVVRDSQADNLTNATTQRPSPPIPLSRIPLVSPQARDLRTYRRAVSLPPGL